MRRLLIAFVAFLASVTSAAAQEPSPRVPVIGVLSPLSEAAAARNITALRQALHDLGHRDGHDVLVDPRFAEGKAERLPALAAELVARRPAVIIAGGTQGVLAVSEATRTIPVVMIAIDPVELGIGAGLARPGGNVTGLTILVDEGIVGKRLQLLTETIAGIRRVAALVNTDEGVDRGWLDSLPTIMGGLNMTVRILDVRRESELEPAVMRGAQEGMQALLVSQGPFFNARRMEIAALASRARLPAIYGFREFVQAGGLMSYGPDLPDLYRHAAAYADKILKGAKAGDLPVQQPTKFELVINLKAAKELGITVPPALLARADEVIE